MNIERPQSLDFVEKLEVAADLMRVGIGAVVVFTLSGIHSGFGARFVG